MGKELSEADFKDTEGQEPEGGMQGGPQGEPDAGGDLSSPPKEPQEVQGGEGEPTPEKGYKHKSWDETEKARVQAEKKMHEEAKRAAEAEKQLARYQQALKNVQPQKQESYRSKILKDVREKIARLDPNDPETEQKAADLWMEAQEQISQHVYESRITQDRERETAMNQVKGEIAKRGFSMKADIPGLGETDLGEEAFWAITLSPLFPSGQPPEVQVEWVFSMMKTYNDAIIKAYEDQKSESPRGPQNILGRGSKGPIPKGKESAKPSTLKEDAEEIMEQKRLKR